jgi:hypothetical protein
VLPDADEPLVHLIANGENQGWIAQMLQDCCVRIQTLEVLEGAINADLEASAV